MSGNDPLIGKQLGDYLIQSVLGQGGMARVYKGYDSRLDRYAAVKVIEPTLTSSEEDEEYRERFQKEARAIARLNHPRVVGVYQFNNLDHIYYMAMVFIEGHDLRTVLKEYARQGKRLSHKQVLRIIGDIAQALDYSHSQGVNHRDIKPSNIMVTADGHAVLTDFGLALNATEGTIGNTFGSVHYIAPEQAMSSAQAVAQSDLYSLGVVLYEVLVGRVPFEDVSAMTVALKHISDPPPPPSTLNPEISTHIEEVVMKILDKDPQKRYATGRAFIYALEGAFSTSNNEDTHGMDDKDVSRVNATQSNTSRRDSSHVPPLIMSPVQDSDRHQQDDVPTISDSSKARPFQASQPSAQVASDDGKSRTGLIIGAVAALIILAIIAAVVVLSGGGNDDENQANANATGTAIALVALEATADADLTETAQQALTDTQATATALTLIEVTDAVEPTATPDEPTATPTPEITPTEEPTIAPTVAGTPIFSTDVLTQAEDAPEEILLRYDGRTLLLFNRSTQRLNISELTFVRQSDSATFRAREWSTSSNDLTSMRPEMCYQVLTTLYLDWDPEDSPRDICQFTQGFRQTSRSFWTVVGVTEDTLFEVRDNGVTLGTCPVTEFESTDEVYCLIDIDPPQDDE